MSTSVSHESGVVKGFECFNKRKFLHQKKYMADKVSPKFRS